METFPDMKQENVDRIHTDGNSESIGNWSYDDADIEPEIHATTVIAAAAMMLLNFVQTFALQGPNVVLTYIGQSLDAERQQTWIPNALSLVQAVVGPVIANASDTFQARKAILVASCLISVVGAAIAPGSQSIGRLIAAQVLIGFGFAAVPLAYCIPSEILPRKWRPACQGAVNVSASLGTITGVLSAGGMVNQDPVSGWRHWYWIQVGLWATTGLFITVGYRPPKRLTALDSVSMSKKIISLDLPGLTLLTAGLTLFLTGMNLGGGLYPWSDRRTLATLIVGIMTMTGFGLYEWKATKTGILHHELFRGGEGKGRSYAICLLLMFIEGIMLFAYVLFYPQLTVHLFETDAWLLAARSVPFWITSGLCTGVYGLISSRFRTVRLPLLFGFVIFAAALVGLATIEPGDSTSAIVFSALGGVGFGAPLILIIAAVHLCTPHHLIATATAVTTSTRAIAATVFTAIYAAALSNRAEKYIPQYVSAAATKSGLSDGCVPNFISSLTSTSPIQLPASCGLTPQITAAGNAALKQANADAIRVVYIIAAPFGALACIALYWLGDLSKTMNWRVEAPVERLVAKAT